MIVLFSVLWNPSNIPLVCGWYDVILLRWKPIKIINYLLEQIGLKLATSVRYVERYPNSRNAIFQKGVGNGFGSDVLKGKCFGPPGGSICTS